MTLPNVLIISDIEDTRYLKQFSSTRKNWNIFWVQIDYRCIGKYVEALQKIVMRNRIDFVVYSEMIKLLIVKVLAE